MSAVKLSVSVEGSLDPLMRALSGLDGPEVRLAARRAARRAAKPVVDDLKRAVLATPGGGPSTGLRSSIAAATGSSITAAGVRFRVNNSRLGSRRSLPAHIDNGRWRHPVFGNRRIWVNQRGKPWFGVTFDRHRDEIRGKVLDAVTDAVRAELGA